MDWSKIPDILAIASLAFAFFSILRRNPTPTHRLWLVGWIFIAIHFIGFAFMALPGSAGLLGLIVGLTSLVEAAIFFMWATVPQQTVVSSRRMAALTLFSTALYVFLSCLPNVPGWAFDMSSLLIAVGPISIGLYYRNAGQHTLRWLTGILHFALGVGLMLNSHLPAGNPDLGVNIILFTVYLECCLYFWYTHRQRTTGSVITILGFLAWSLVFLADPFLQHYFPRVHLENEVWNLPKYVVAVGMLLLLLERQIERSQYLALHDDLTALANRRLFQDRLTSAMERARRTGASMALLQIDLDRFKEVNDAHGHHVGDLLLQHVSMLFDSRVRRSDTVARTGGDEFSLILEEPSTRQDAELVADSLIHLLAEPVEIAGRRIRIGASIGIAIYPEDAHNADSLCISADMKMYEIKQQHRDRPIEPMDIQHVQHQSHTMAS
jgi:diguanylate cyclase (GGDEF)-like protein